MEFQILHRHSTSFISSKFLGATQRIDVYLVETVTMSALLSTKQLCIQLFLSVFYFISSHTPPRPPPSFSLSFLWFTSPFFFLFIPSFFSFFLSFFFFFLPHFFFLCLLFIFTWMIQLYGPTTTSVSIVIYLAYLESRWQTRQQANHSRTGEEVNLKSSA